jgi:signal transduction histidine kinase
MPSFPTEGTPRGTVVPSGFGTPPVPLTETLQFENLVAQWTIPAVVVDSEGNVVAWNRGAEIFYGCPRSEVVHRRWVDAVGENAAMEPPRGAEWCTHHFDTRHRTQTGRVLNVRVARTEVPSRPGRRPASLYVLSERADARDLQARLERRVAALHILHEIGEALQSATGLDGILRTILVGATAGQGLSFNRAFLLLAEEEHGELRGRAAVGPSDAGEADRIWSELTLRSESLPSLLRGLEPYLEASDRKVNEIVGGLRVALDGDAFLARAFRSSSTLWIDGGREKATGRGVEESLLDRLGVRSFVAVPLVADSRHIGLLLADNAITGRRIDFEDIEVLELLGMQAAVAIRRARLTEELEAQAATLEKAYDDLHESGRRLFRAERLSSIGHMAARVAHEIKNPLVAIGGFARSLLEDARDDDPARESLGIIVDEVRRLEKILAQMLDYASDGRPRARSVDLPRIASESFNLMQWEMDHAGVAGHLEVEDAVPPCACDRDQIFQAMVILLQNAVHAMPAGGDLAVRIRPDGDRVVIEVEDSGIGIPENIRERMFDPFFTTKPGGTGLGMPIVSQIVRNHGGELEVESREGEGTRVFVRLPVTMNGEDHHA